MDGSSRDHAQTDCSALEAGDVRAQEPPEPVAWTGSGSLAAIAAGCEGFIWGSAAPSHPVPLYKAPIPATEPIEALAAWMIANSYATGHGDTVEDLLRELDWQHAKKIAALSSAIRILGDTGRSDTARILDARDRLVIGRGEIMRHSTDDAMNDALAKDAAILEAFGQDAGPTIEDLFDDCGWIPYQENGDPPVTAGTTVTIRFRDGSEMTDIVRSGAQWSSGEAGYEDAADVVAYRVVTDNG